MVTSAAYTPTTPLSALSPLDSVSKYGQYAWGGSAGATPQPRTVLNQAQTYQAKSGSGLPLSQTPQSVFSIVNAGQQNRRALYAQQAYNVRAQQNAQRQQSLMAPQTEYGVTHSGIQAKPKAGTGYGGVYGLLPQAGTRVQQLQSAYKAHFGTDLPINSAYRSYADQMVAYNKYLHGGPLAAKPGTSVHEQGRAVDFGGAGLSASSPQHAWLAANAPTFGWVWAGKAFGESWHFEYRG